MSAPPLAIDSVAWPGGGAIGMCHCPGRSGAFGWTRSLADDLAAIEAWGASTLLSLVQVHEFARLGVPDFAEQVARTRLQWLHVPIADLSTPDADTFTAWRAERPRLSDALARGDRVVVHCAAGLGRTGTLVARLLVDAGVDPALAIAQVRRARPGTIETAAQAAFVRDDRRFGLRD